MKVSELIQLDCRKEENMEMLQEAVAKMPLFEGKQKVSITSLEKALNKMCRKYPISLSYIMVGPIDEPYYTFMFKRTDDHKWQKTVYGFSMTEGFMKSVLYVYGWIKKYKEENNED